MLEPLLASSERRGRPPKWPARRTADAVFYLLRSGCSWRMLPREYPPSWQTFGKWRRDGRLRQAHDRLRAAVREAQGKHFLAEPANVLLTTPESLEVLLMTGRARRHRLFEHLRFVVVDEIHALAANDRGAHLLAVVERLVHLSGTDPQRVGLSATVGNPEDLAGWMQGSSERLRTVVAPPTQKTARRIVVRHVGEDVEHTAARAVPLAYGRKSIFFTQGRAETERVRQAFDRMGVPAFVHHSSVSWEFREGDETRFMSTEGPATLVSTSTLELGIDVGDLDLVLQLDAPFTVSSFLQRMGRTGRRPGAH